MESIVTEYAGILVFFILAVVMGIAMMAGAWFAARQNPDFEKNSPYECGFPPFSDSRMKFDVKFYLVSLLFIIFDLEVAFLFPWALVLDDMPNQIFAFWSMFVFLAVLTIGFIYEWKKGALEWN
jgi:NADH-quinone oxidoreductase subunit A